MKKQRKTIGDKQAFTIIELLTVMSIIIILIGLLVPALNRIRRYAQEVNQENQFAAIDKALALFARPESGGGYADYPPSSAEDDMNNLYPGAMKLAEAMVGQDLIGFNRNSMFRQDGTDASGTQIYRLQETDPDYENSLANRVGCYLPPDRANPYPIKAIYPTITDPPWDEDNLVLCDVFTKVTNLIQEGPSRIGMPILYYRARENLYHRPIEGGGTRSITECIYNYEDNDDLVGLGLPWAPTQDHPIYSGDPNGVTTFYDNIRNKKVAPPVDGGDVPERPHNAESYILWSAGWDGIYGTEDDMFNFQKD